MKRLLSLLSFGFAFGLSAQTYTFSHAVNPYVELTNPEYLTPEGQIWDDPDYTVSFPFPFQFFGQNLSEFFGTPGLGSDLYTSTSDVFSMIIPVFCDVIDMGTASGVSQSSISKEKVGTVGSRILKIQWKNVSFYDHVGAVDPPTDFMNFQVWFYEGTNVIEIRFGSSNITDETNFPTPGPSVILVNSFNGATETIASSYYLSGDPAAPVMSATTDLNELIGGFLTSMPASGQTYIFTPSTSNPSGLEEKQSSQLTIYPNPANHMLFLSDTKNITKVELMDVAGRLIKNFTALENGLDISELNAGAYLIVIENGVERITKHFTKL